MPTYANILLWLLSSCGAAFLAVRSVNGRLTSSAATAESESTELDSAATAEHEPHDTDAGSAEPNATATESDATTTDKPEPDVTATDNPEPDATTSEPGATSPVESESESGPDATVTEPDDSEPDDATATESDVVTPKSDAAASVDSGSEPDVAAPEPAPAPAEARASTWADTPYTWGVPSYVAATCGAALTAAAAFFVSHATSLVTVQLALLLCYVATLAAALTDAKLRIIPNRITFGLVGARALLYVVEFGMLAFAPAASATQDQFTAIGHLLSSIAGFLVCFVVLALSGRIAKGGVGGGDIKLVAAVGFAGGIYAAIYSLLYALVAFALVALVLVVLKRKGRKDSLPFAPFMYLGYTCALLLSTY